MKCYMFELEVAEKYGVDAAIMLYHFQHWIFVNRANGKHFYDGRTWTFSSVRALTEIWPFWSRYHINRQLSKLVKDGILVKSNHNPSGYDRTAWYAFKDEKSWFQSREAILQKRKMDLAQSQNRFRKSAKPIPNTRPNISADESQSNLVLSEKKLLGLQDEIDQAKDLLLKRLDLYLKRYYTKNSPKTLAGIIAHFCHEAKKDPTKLAWFKEAVEWAAQASRATVPNKVGLFVKKVKEQTTYRGAGRLLRAGILKAVNL